RVQEAVRSGAGETFLEQFEVPGDARVGGVVAGERLGEIEDEIAVEARERVEALDRSVEAVERRVVTEFAEGLGDFVFDFLLVQRPRQRRLLIPGGLFVPLVPSIVQNYDVQGAHASGL